MLAERFLYVCEHCNTSYTTKEQAIECRNLPTKDFGVGVGERVIHKMHLEPHKSRSHYQYQGQVVSVERRPMITTYFSKALGIYVTGPVHVNLIRVLLDEPHPHDDETLFWFREEDFLPVRDQSTAPYQKN